MAPTTTQHIARVEKALDEAREAFWRKITEHFPEAKTGDFGPEEHFDFDMATRRAVDTWLFYNISTSIDDEGESSDV